MVGSCAEEKQGESLSPPTSGDALYDREDVFDEGDSGFSPDQYPRRLEAGGDHRRLGQLPQR